MAVRLLSFFLALALALALSISLSLSLSLSHTKSLPHLADSGSDARRAAKVTVRLSCSRRCARCACLLAHSGMLDFSSPLSVALSLFLSLSPPPLPLPPPPFLSRPLAVSLSHTHPHLVGSGDKARGRLPGEHGRAPVIQEPRRHILVLRVECECVCECV